MGPAPWATLPTAQAVGFGGAGWGGSFPSLFPIIRRGLAEAGRWVGRKTLVSGGKTNYHRPAPPKTKARVSQLMGSPNRWVPSPNAALRCRGAKFRGLKSVHPTREISPRPGEGIPLPAAPLPAKGWVALVSPSYFQPGLSAGAGGEYPCPGPGKVPQPPPESNQAPRPGGPAGGGCAAKRRVKARG